jgi:RNA polymerase sigma-70 factor (ECF subfamily)
VGILETRTRTGDSPERHALIETLRRGGTMHGRTAAALRDLLLRTARFEVDRRCGAPTLDGPEADELTRQAADGALAAIAAHLDDRPRPDSFTAWVRKFAVTEVSAKIARHVWSAAAIPADQEGWEQLPRVLGLRPDEDAAWAGPLAALQRAADENLSELQLAVFLAITFRRPSIDEVALERSSSRSAIYKALFEARRLLRARLAAEGFDPDPAGRGPQARLRGLDQLLSVTPGDAGCDVTFQKLDSYVEIERRGLDPAQSWAAVAVHLRSCAACHEDYQGLVATSHLQWPSAP